MPNISQSCKDGHEHIQWVIVEMKQENNDWKAIAEPCTLRVLDGRQTTIVWYVFTEGFELVGIDLSKTSYKGLARADQTRRGCWSAKLNVGDTAGWEQQDYSIHIRHKGTGKTYQHDPVIENDPPTT